MVETAPKPETLSLEAKVGQLLHVGIGLGQFETATGWPDERMQSLIESVQPGAVRVYGSHAGTPYFMAEYANQLQTWAADTEAGVPLLLSSDCEHGADGVIEYGVQAYPSLMGRTATGDRDLARDVSGAIARDMLAVGLNMNHQPVVDVATNPDNPVIGVRSAGSDPETVTAYAKACLEGIHAADQIAVAKHFPGHGDTDRDSHIELPHVTYDRETLEEIHLPPFEAMIDAGVDCIMTSHIVVDCLDPRGPATLSRPIVTDLLRKELGFDGVVLTDAMMMDAIADNYGVGDAAVRAIDAGVDLLLTGFVPEPIIRETRDAIVDAVDTGVLAASRIDESVRRIFRLKEAYELADRRRVDPIEALETTRSEAHESIARTAYERSFTVRDDDGIVPVDGGTTVLLTGVRGVHDLEPAFHTAFETVVACSFAPRWERASNDEKPPVDPGESASRLRVVRSMSDDFDVAVVTTYAREEFSAGQRRIVEELAAEIPVVVVSLGLPNEFDQLPDGVAYVATCVQDRLGLPEPFPSTAGAALVSVLTGKTDADAP